jgi:hypothetical protein
MLIAIKKTLNPKPNLDPLFCTWLIHFLEQASNGFCSCCCFCLSQLNHISVSCLAVVRRSFHTIVWIIDAWLASMEIDCSCFLGVGVVICSMLLKCRGPSCCAVGQQGTITTDMPIGDIHKVLQLLYQTTQTNHSSLRSVDRTWMTDDNVWNKIHWLEDTAMYTPVWPGSFRTSRGWSHEQIKNMGHQVCTLMLWVFLSDYIPIREMVLPEWEHQMVWNCICEFALNKEKARLECMIIHTFPQDPWSVMAPSIQLCKNVFTVRLVLNLDRLHRIKLLSWHRYTRLLVTHYTLHWIPAKKSCIQKLAETLFKGNPELTVFWAQKNCISHNLGKVAENFFHLGCCMGDPLE